MEELAFDYGNDRINPDRSTRVEWKCVNGGTEVLVNKMRDEWGIKINYLKRVTSVARDWTQDDQTPQNDQTPKDDRTLSLGQDKMIVKYVECPPPPNYVSTTTKSEVKTEPGKTVTERYATVINTTTLAALRQMDLSELDLSYAAKAAIRSLHYEVSCKLSALPSTNAQF